MHLRLASHSISINFEHDIVPVAFYNPTPLGGEHAEHQNKLLHSRTVFVDHWCACMHRYRYMQSVINAVYNIWFDYLIDQIIVPQQHGTHLNIWQCSTAN